MRDNLKHRSQIDGIYKLVLAKLSAAFSLSKKKKGFEVGRIRSFPDVGRGKRPDHIIAWRGSDHVV
jgi:hypothetical protein